LIGVREDLRSGHSDRQWRTAIGAPSAMSLDRLKPAQGQQEPAPRGDNSAQAPQGSFSRELFEVRRAFPSEQGQRLTYDRESQERIKPPTRPTGSDSAASGTCDEQSRFSDLLAQLSYSTTSTQSTCPIGSARCIEWGEDAETKETPNSNLAVRRPTAENVGRDPLWSRPPPQEVVGKYVFLLGGRTRARTWDPLIKSRRVFLSSVISLQLDRSSYLFAGKRQSFRARAKTSLLLAGCA
jgi:hypothetical protein